MTLYRLTTTRECEGCFGTGGFRENGALIARCRDCAGTGREVAGDPVVVPEAILRADLRDGGTVGPLLDGVTITVEALA